MFQGKQIQMRDSFQSEERKQQRILHLIGTRDRKDHQLTRTRSDRGERGKHRKDDDTKKEEDLKRPFQAKIQTMTQTSRMARSLGRREEKIRGIVRSPADDTRTEISMHMEIHDGSDSSS